ncbi:thiamine pyrophosphate-binding protein [Bradyrhizobium sp. LHD-71]|uniref:thiamine pyrophosphate-binding protein n=1 Tax=Bradyrhizobium sp. LHD-71 TaxID=3072141 RepID=UPI00280D6766|nr:thiamine pyrophosphate-binding protein [Bradyrhizobium sp. LHD-71]MDQ8730439.1 thiamine pyrophosphate-binding protein [Bradyrhizobium sp. LHD-71]
MSKTKTVANLWAERLASYGVKRFFGVPGGDCSLDIIQAAADHGIDFVLTRAEAAASIMAATTGELTGTPGVVMTSRGPGIANAMNGVAYAALDRAPLMVLADAYDGTNEHVSHQRFDQVAMLKPLTKAHDHLGGENAAKRLDELAETSLASPQGAVYLELRGSDIRAQTSEPIERTKPAPRPAAPHLPPKVQELLNRAERPVIIAGLQACETTAAAMLRKLMAGWDVPILVTYKAKGVVPDDDDHLIGYYIGGVAEEPWLKQADLIVFFGFDAIELPPHKWRYSAPMVEITAYPFDRNIISPDVVVVGPLDELGAALLKLKINSKWPVDFRATAKRSIAERARVGDGGPISPHMLVDAVIEAAPRNARITLDAGAHMIPVLHQWKATEPRQTLISRGDATMGFALPAAIASALAEPGRPVIGFTGDGGLMMCAGELGTAAQYRCNLVLIVFNDESLTLIGARQRRRQLPNAGVDFSPADFSKIAEGFGCLGLRVEQPEQLKPAMKRAFSAQGPVVVDVRVNPAAYHEQLVSLRG